MLPKPLAVLVGVFFLMPLTSLAFHGMPLDLFAREGWVSTAVVLAAYWFGPWLLVGAVLVRRFLFFPFYLLECALLGVHCYYFGQSLPTDLLMFRYLFIGLMAYLGMLLTNRDFVFPFLSSNGRAWRKARRYDVEVGLQIRSAQADQRVEALMENCSATGMGIRIPKTQFKGFLKKMRRGHRLEVLIDRIGLETRLPVEVVWLYEYPDYWTLGLRVLDTNSMIQFVASVTGLENRIRPLQMSHMQLLEADMRDTAFVIWVVFILLSFGMPAFA